MTVKVTHSTPADGTFSAQGALAWDADHTLAGLGTMAEQNASNVSITGGSITGITIGSATNIAGGTANQLLYQTGASATSFITAPTVADTYLNWSGSAFQWSANPLGDVVGPASATDNAVARFDLTTGKLIQNSVVTVSDTGDIAGATTVTDINYIDFNTAYATTLGVGQLGWDGNNTLGLGMTNGNIVQEIGLQTFIYGRASATITKGQLIKKTGVNGTSGVITFAPTTANMTNGTEIIGIAAESIALNSFGYIISTGNLRGFNTTGASSSETWADNDILYYNPAGNGLMTNVKPSAPNIKVEVATITNASSGGSGSVAVEINHGSVLGGTDSNVQINGETGGQLLSYDQTAGYWKNTSLTAGTGISVNSATNGVITVTNSAPDQTVALTGAGTTSISGTYPNFTITSNDQYVGTVTSVSGTGTVSGISLSGTVTSTGNLTLGGSLDLSSPPAIGGSVPNAITGTTITASQYVNVGGGNF